MLEKVAETVALIASLAVLTIQVAWPGSSYIPGLVALAICVSAIVLSGSSAKNSTIPFISLAICVSALVGAFFVHRIAAWELNLLATSSVVQQKDIDFLNRTIVLVPAILAVAVVAVGAYHNKNKASMTVQSGASTAVKDLFTNKGDKAFDLTLGSAHVPQRDRYMHTMVIGTTGTGKSSRLLKPMIYQDLEKIAAGKKAGITVIEPKGDLAADVAEMAKSFGVPVTFINPEDPNTPVFNPLEGDATTVAEITRTVLQALFGKQEAFFRQAQETVAKNTVMLLKTARGDNVTMRDLAMSLQDTSILTSTVEQIEEESGQTALTQFFRKELLNEKSDLHKHILGLRLQLEDITSNEMLNRALIGKSDVNLDDHLENGGVLVINTAMGPLGKLGDVFGKFVILHYQSAIFRRPGTPQTRLPNFLYIDEAPRYMNPEFEALLAMARSYRCAATLALQNTAQLKLDANPAFRDIVLELLRNKFILNLGSADDARRFATELGEDETIKASKTYKRTGPIVVPLIEDSVRHDERFEGRLNYTQLMELPAFTCAYKVCHNDAPQPPGLTKLDLCPFDKERWDNSSSGISLDSVKSKFKDLTEKDKLARTKPEQPPKQPLDDLSHQNDLEQRPEYESFKSNSWVPQGPIEKIPDYTVAGVAHTNLYNESTPLEADTAPSTPSVKMQEEPQEPANTQDNKQDKQEDSFFADKRAHEINPVDSEKQIEQQLERKKQQEETKRNQLEYEEYQHSLNSDEDTDFLEDTFEETYEDYEEIFTEDQFDSTPPF